MKHYLPKRVNAIRHGPNKSVVHQMPTYEALTIFWGNVSAARAFAKSYQCHR